ncbi:MAG: hypothetical protein AAFP02_19875 [Bacteroidota bacterium]
METQCVFLEKRSAKQLSKLSSDKASLCAQKSVPLQPEKADWYSHVRLKNAKIPIV